MFVWYSFYMKCILFVDGSNLFGGMEEMLGVGKYWRFGSLLQQMKLDQKIEQVLFYGTYMRIDSTGGKTHVARVKAQKKFFDSAKNDNRVRFFKGHFSGAGKEKGVDVHLAVDMVLGAMENRYDSAAVMTGDADLKYAVERVRALGKEVKIMALGTRFPFGISPIVQGRYVYDWQNVFCQDVLPKYRRKPKNLFVRELKGALKVYSVKK